MNRVMESKKLNQGELSGLSHTKLSNADYEKRKQQWGRFLKAWETGGEEEIKRLFLEMGEDERRADQERTVKLLKETCNRIPEEHQPPNLPRCVHSIMEELRGVGVWDGGSNTTYDRAVKALRSYGKADYEDDLTKLAINLAFKYILPFSNTCRDPLKWFLERSEVIRICNIRGVKLSPRTLNIYQKQGLICPPVRLDKKAHYSFLTVFRIIWIADFKKAGHNLLPIKDIVDGTLKTMLEELFKKFADDRLPVEDAGAAIVNIIRLEYGTKFFEDRFWKSTNNKGGIK